jgi:vancomycin resistance protein YoaR
MRKARRAALAVLASLLATAVAVGFAFAGSADTIAAGVTVSGVKVGGKSVDDATLQLKARARRAADTPLTFAAGNQRFQFTARQLGVTVDWEAAVREASRYGDGFGPVRGFRRLALRFSGRDVTPSVHAYDTIVASAVRALAEKVDRPHVPASIELTGIEPSIVPGQSGRVLDQKAAAAVIVGALAAGDQGRQVALPLRVDGVRVTAASLAPVVEKLRTMLSAPVRLRYGAAYAALTPRQLASMIEVPPPGSSDLTIGGPKADRILGRLSKIVDRPATDATFTVGADGLPAVVPSVEGRTLDRVATAKAILAAAALPGDRVGDLAVTTAPPKRTTAQATAMGVKEVVGTYETTYGGIANRLHNVRLVATLVDDHFIAPGQSFSFNRTTGERTAAKGFVEAPVIINGELQSGLGGGVCQVSTTIFNAAFEAGLPITARTNHALYISHYPLGRDATVDYPETDLVFRNDTDHWIWLRAFIGDTSLRVTLFGTSPHRRVESTTAPLRATGAVPIKKVDDSTLPKGKKVVDPDQVVAPPQGTSVHRIVYDTSGKVLYDSVWYSYYRGEPRIVRVGTKPKPANKAAVNPDGSVIALH